MEAGGGHHRGGGGFPGGGGGGFPLFQGGGFPGGGSQYPDNGGSPVSQTTAAVLKTTAAATVGKQGRRPVEVSGELWLSDAIRLPDDKKATDLPAIETAAYQGQLAYKPLTDSVNKNKDIPLDSRLTFTHTVRRSGSAGLGHDHHAHRLDIDWPAARRDVSAAAWLYPNRTAVRRHCPKTPPADDNGGGGNYHVTGRPGRVVGQFIARGVSRP